MNGVWEGLSTVWHSNGNKKKTGYNKNGKEQGKWTYWNNKGFKIKTVNFKNGEIDGDVVEFSSSGKEDGRQTYINGRLQDELSYEYEYYDSGPIKTKRSYRNNVEVGTWTVWFENGNTKEEGSWKDGEYSLNNRWNSNGDFLVKNGKGGWVSRNEDGTKKRKQMYDDGQLILDLLFSQEYYDDGQIKSEKSHEDGNPNGDWITWHPNGQKQEEGVWKNDEYFIINRWSIKGKFLVKNGDGGWIAKTNKGRNEWKKIYKDGRLVGKWDYKYSEYENGKLKSIVSYKNGIRDGVWVVWHENGRKKEEGIIRDGVESGEWTFWDEKGNVTEVKNFDGIK